MTQSQKAEKPAASCAGELLWNLSLLPLSRPQQPAPTAIVIELPLDPGSREATQRRKAA